MHATHCASRRTASHGVAPPSALWQPYSGSKVRRRDAGAAGRWLRAQRVQRAVRGVSLGGMRAPGMAQTTLPESFHGKTGLMGFHPIAPYRKRIPAFRFDDIFPLLLYQPLMESISLDHNLQQKYISFFSFGLCTWGMYHACKSLQAAGIWYSGVPFQCRSTQQVSADKD